MVTIDSFVLFVFFIIPLYCVPESRSHFIFTAVLFELRYLFLCYISL